MLTQGIRKFYQIFPGQYHLLGLGMHPTLTPGRTAVWDHDEGEYYEAYDRLFNIRQHGWLNIQALQVNLSYAGEKDLLMQYNRIRTLLPYLIALTASSPMVEGRLTGKMDNRLIYYRENQKEIPQICNGIIPARIRSVADTARHRSRSSRHSGRGTQGSSARNGSIRAGSSSVSPGAASRSRPRTNRNASAPIWRSRHW